MVALQQNHVKIHSVDAMLPIYPVHSFAHGGDPAACNTPFQGKTNTDEAGEKSDNDDIPQIRDL